jgi:ATP-dependent Clp protease ATP-binding subunit ClpA
MVTVSKELQQTLQAALADARQRNHEYVTLEHLLYALTNDKVAKEVLLACGADLERLRTEISDYFERALQAVGVDRDPEQTAAFQRVLQRAAWHVQGSGRTELHAGDVLVAITREKGSHAVQLLEGQGIRRIDILQFVSHGATKDAAEDATTPEETDEGDGDEGPRSQSQRPAKDPFRTFTTDLVERASKGLIDPLIGRQAEVERMIQVLCRRRKNNPVLVGDPGHRSCELGRETYRLVGEHSALGRRPTVRTAGRSGRDNAGTSRGSPRDLVFLIQGEQGKNLKEDGSTRKRLTYPRVL